MSTLSLDLRGVEASLVLPREAPAKGAGVSLLLHSVGIATLVLVPVLQATSLPEVASGIAPPLIRPLTVLLPPAPLRVTPMRRGSSIRPTHSLAVVPTTPRDTPSSLAVVHDPDVGPGLLTDTGDADAGKDGSVGGTCPLGSVCAPSVPVPAPPAPLVHIGGVIREPHLRESRAPVYPPMAQAARVSGRVVLEAHVGLDGRVKEVRITQSHALFDEAALASVRSRLYEPLLLNGVPTEFLVTITVAFNVR